MAATGVDNKLTWEVFFMWNPKASEMWFPKIKKEERERMKRRTISAFYDKQIKGYIS